MFTENGFADNNAVVAALSAYLITMLGIGVYASRRTSTAADYILGGRSLGPWPSALSAGASDMSGWLLLGLPGYAFAAGIEAFWMAGGLLLGTYANWLFVARRLRIYSVLAGQSLTLPTFFDNRFGGGNRGLRVTSSAFIILFYLFYTSAGLVAGGKLFETVFGLDYQWAVFVGAACIVLYTFLGGFLAVSWTDLVQGLLMAAALVYVPVVVVQAIGGPGEVLTALEARNPNLLTLWRDAQGSPLSAIAIISLAGWGLGYFGQPHILARFKAIRSSDELPAARRIAITWTTVSLLGALAVGLAGSVYADVFLATEIADPEKIFMVLVNALFHPLVAGILLAAILAAIMSTADSQLLVASSSFTEDMYRPLLRRNAGEKEVVLTARLAVLGVSLIALLLAMNPESTVLGLVAYAWAGFGAAFGPVLLFSIYWKRMNRFGALTGIVAGGVTTVVWKQLEGGIFELYELVPAFLGASIAAVVGSFATEEPPGNVQTQFDTLQVAPER